MAGNLTNFLVHELLDHAFRNAAYTPPATVFLGLSTTIPNDDGTNFTEVSTVGTAYVRQAVNWTAAGGRETRNSGSITFPIATAPWGTIVAWGVFDAVSGGNMLAYGEALGAGVFATVDPATDFFSCAVFGFPHNFVLDTQVQVEVENGQMPSPLVDNTTYFVRDQTAFTFKLAATAGGAAINILSTGNGTIWVADQYKLVVTTGDRYQIASGDLLLRVRAFLGT